MDSSTNQEKSVCSLELYTRETYSLHVYDFIPIAPGARSERLPKVSHFMKLDLSLHLRLFLFSVMSSL